MNNEDKLEFKFGATDLVAWILGFVFIISSITTLVLEKQTFPVFIFQIILSWSLFLSFFVDKYLQLSSIVLALLYLGLYVFMVNFLVVGHILEILVYADNELFVNGLLIMVFFIFLGLVIASLVTYDNKVLVACSLLLVLFCLLNATFATFTYFKEVLEVSAFNFTDFFIIFFQFYLVLMAIFSLFFSLIMGITHSIHLKIIPNIKAMRYD